MYEIELSDGTKLTGLTLSGNTFFTKEQLKREQFTGKLDGVKIVSTDANDQTLCGYYAHMKLGTLQDTRHIHGLPGGTYFILEDTASTVTEIDRMNAKIEYLAMMSDIDMEG